MNKISTPFLITASDILGDTNKGLTTAQIVKYFNQKAFELSVEIPHSSYIHTISPNKRTMLLENLKVFNPEQQIEIILELCGYGMFNSNEAAQNLKKKITENYPNLINLSTIKENTKLVNEANNKPQIPQNNTMNEDDKIQSEKKDNKILEWLKSVFIPLLGILIGGGGIYGVYTLVSNPTPVSPKIETKTVRGTLTNNETGDLIKDVVYVKLKTDNGEIPHDAISGEEFTFKGIKISENEATLEFSVKLKNTEPVDATMVLTDEDKKKSTISKRLFVSTKKK